MNDTPAHEFFPSWDETHQLSRKLGQLLSGKSWKGIIGVARGGLVPACLVAQELNIRDVQSISVISYNHQDRAEPRLLHPIDWAGDGEGWLIVEDLADTGGTFRFLRTLLPKAHFSALYVKPMGRPTADTFVAEVPQETWIFFPWEIETQQYKADKGLI
jgi:xanthine phosphoribosyltransferase